MNNSSMFLVVCVFCGCEFVLSVAVNTSHISNENTLFSLLKSCLPHCYYFVPKWKQVSLLILLSHICLSPNENTLFWNPVAIHMHFCSSPNLMLSHPVHALARTIRCICKSWETFCICCIISVKVLYHNHHGVYSQINSHVIILTMHLQVTPSGRAHKSGLVTGDYITAINGQETKPLKHMQAMQLIKKSTQKVELTWWVYT